MSEEPIFELYHVDREEVPTIDQEHNSDEEFDLDDVEPDEEIRGYKRTQEFIDNNKEMVSVNRGSTSSSDIPMSKYRWTEAGKENAPEKTVCSECGKTVKTNSEELLKEKKQVHHISTGH